MRTAAFVHATEIGWTRMADGVRRQVLGHGSDLMIVRVEFESGAAGAVHHHPHRQATYIVEGCFEVSVGEQKSELRAGDCFYAEADVPHGVKALERGVLVDVFTPVRNDFLQPPP